MSFKIVTGLDFEEDFLRKVMDLDELVYEKKYAGELKNMVARYRANRDSFICVLDEEREQRLAGYVNFFPCTQGLWESLENLDENSPIRDDDIRADEIAQYTKEGENRLFILSLVVHPDYRDKKAVVALSEAWRAHLEKLNGEYPLTAIRAIAVSEDGKKALRNYMFTIERMLIDNNVLCICEGKALEKLIHKNEKRDLYFKSYRSDVYLMLPLAEHVENTHLEELFEDRSEAMKNPPPEAEALVEGLLECLRYEMSNVVLKELDDNIFYLGEYYFLHTTDEYPQEKDEQASIVGEEKVQVLLTAHRPSHMYVLTLFFKDTPFSTTQIQDQLSYGFLRLRTADAAPLTGYEDIYDYLRKYGLHKCGEGKALLCMSKKPDDPREFQNIMSGEVYNSMHIDYGIQSKEIEEMCETNHAQYDYYQVYLSDVAIAYIPEVFDEDVQERIALTSTYAFIAQLVMFQNTALAKTNIKVANALANDGDISQEEIHELYREFGKTVRFWEVRNFKYSGTQAEAACITKAFANEELKQTYYEHQEFLEHIVDLKSAQTEARNGAILNIVATVLAVIQIQDFAVGLLAGFYNLLGIDAVYAQSTFQSVIISGTLTFLLLYMILKRKRRNIHRHNLM